MLTVKESEELESLLIHQQSRTRWLSQQEFDRINELRKKKFESEIYELIEGNVSSNNEFDRTYHLVYSQIHSNGLIKFVVETKEIKIPVENRVTLEELKFAYKNDTINGLKYNPSNCK
jgi:hypothetical protein